MSRARGRELYHLHEYPMERDRSEFERLLFAQCKCKWKRLSWTICTYVWITEECARDGMRGLDETLVELVVPESCEEVMLELETRGGQVAGWDGLMEVANICKKTEIERRDGRELLYDEELSVEYSSKGKVENDEARVRWNLTERDVDVEHQTIRLCWRTGKRRREYLHYDPLDCMSLDGSRIKEVKPLGWTT
jgi:hypothetical protein